ncbi:MAG: hypothetical protein KAU20_02160 [Nanoarchaeota archaeon]|nr:hypothetical protein [Nanoarchaeota archaeon]
MEKSNIKSRYAIFLIFLLFLLLIPISYASYAVSTPYTLTIEKGSFKEFDFQIQAYNSKYDLICRYNIGNTSPFEIIFREEGLDVEKRSFSVVKGIVKTPKDIEDGAYKYDFCIECLPKEKQSGATANFRFCGIPININIITPEKEILSLTKITIIIALPILIIILLIMIIILMRKRKTRRP